MSSRLAIVSALSFLAFIFITKFTILPLTRSPAVTVLKSTTEWTFNTRLHGNLHSLSNEQCISAFPRLYDRIRVAVGQRAENPIRPDEIQIERGRCMLKVLIYQGSMYVTDTGAYLDCYVSNGRERIVATLNLLHRAITSAPSPLPDVEFPISYDDLPTRSTHGITWGYTRKSDEDNVWLMPDYGYWSWFAIGIPSFNSLSRSIEQVNVVNPWTKKISKAVWRGTPHYAPEIRETLIEVTKGKEWADVRVATIGTDERDFLGLDEHCQYQYVLQTEGTSYTGRIKFLQLCDSVVVSHKLAYSEFATHLLQPSGPNQNFVETSRDWSDLEDKMKHLRTHPEEARAIAKRSHEVFAQRYLTPAAVSCYLRESIQGWAEVQGFEVNLYENLTGSPVRKPRGIPFEAFAVSFPQDKPGEYGIHAHG